MVWAGAPYRVMEQTWTQFLHRHYCLKPKIGTCWTDHPSGPWSHHTTSPCEYLWLYLLEVGEQKQVFLGSTLCAFLKLPQKVTLWVSWGPHFAMQTCKGSLQPILQLINEDGKQWQPQYQLLRNVVVTRCQLDFVPLIADCITPSPAGQLIFHPVCRSLIQIISLQFGYKNTMRNHIKSLVKSK